MTQFVMNVPATNDRQFTIKIGKITDTSILSKIKNGESDGFSNLEVYAKANSAIYEQKVTSNSHVHGLTYYEKINISASQLEDKEYYYLYIIFDDEDGKYYPIEHCLTFSQASVPTSSSWFLHFYGSNDFNWKEFSTDGTGGTYIPGSTGTEKKDETTATGKLPYTGKHFALFIAILAFIAIGGIAYYQNRKYSSIK